MRSVLPGARESRRDGIDVERSQVPEQNNPGCIHHATTGSPESRIGAWPRTGPGEDNSGRSGEDRPLLPGWGVRQTLKRTMLLKTHFVTQW